MLGSEVIQEQFALSEENPPAECSIAERAAWLCESTPHKRRPYSQRNWGGPLHSLCSYQGKLKPSIAHFLVKYFTSPGEIVLDPLAGIGTIPLEARRLGRIGLGNDLSPLAYAVTSAKLEHLDTNILRTLSDDLSAAVRAGSRNEKPFDSTDVEWGLNGPIHSYYHPQTLAEIVAARTYLHSLPAGPEINLLRASILHILHGNRPYALSRRSHPVTPLAPTGAAEYRSLIDRLTKRLDRVLPQLLQLRESTPYGQAFQADFRDLHVQSVDAVITSPPFARSLRFWSANWLRLWFSGWDREDFETQPPRYLETQQKNGYSPYKDLITMSARSLRRNGILILHLGQTKSECMADNILPLLSPDFRVLFVGKENVEDTQSFGLTDKGATIAHWYIFCERRDNRQQSLSRL